MKPPLRTKSVGTKVSEAEFALLEERARGAGMRLVEWVREALLAAPVEPGASSGVDSGEVALGEIRTLYPIPNYPDYPTPFNPASSWITPSPTTTSTAAASTDSRPPHQPHHPFPRYSPVNYSDG